MKILKDRYEIINKIGTGGMADVYLAEDKELNRNVAIKILHERYAADTVFIERFKREARSAANLSHPNIVNIYDWGKDDEGYFLVMEVLKGKSLKELITERGYLSEDDAIAIALQVCSALGYAHHNRIVHRDIKPHNIVIDDSGHVKVTDFGIARIVEDGATVTQTGAMIGTPQYFSPEQAQGYITGAPSDLYSLGITIFEMVTGRLPFNGDNPVTIAFKQVHEEPPVPSEFRADLSPEMDQIILRALRKEPEDRYTSAEDMGVDLKLLRQGEPIEKTIVMNTPIRKQETRKERKGKRYAPWIVVILLLLMAVAGLGYSLYQANQPKAIAIPDVTGKRRGHAVDILEAAGFVAEVRKETSSDIPKDRVIGQAPSSDKSAPYGSTVILQVSLGAPQVMVPDVIGQTESNAANIIGRQELSLGETTYEFSNHYAKGTVIRQVPTAGMEVGEGTEVQLIVSNGKDIVKVPDLVGMTKEKAMATLAGINLTVKELSEFSNDHAAGIVIAQSPGAEVEIARGSTVTIRVSKGSNQIILKDYRKQPDKVAINDLTNLGFKVSVKEREAPRFEDGVVINQSPAPGASVSIGSTITLIVVKNKPQGEPSTSSINQ